MMNRLFTLLLAASCLTAVGQDTTMVCGYGITSQGGGISTWPYADIFIPSNQKAVTIYADFYRPQYSGSALDFSAAYCAGCSDSDLVDWSPYPNFFLWNYDTIPFPMYGAELLFDDISNSEVIGPGYLRILAPLTSENDEWSDLCIGFLELSGCMDNQACNYSEEILISNPESCDYSCCPGPGCCHEGTIWDSNLQQCIVANPSDSNFDGCVQLNDLLDLLSAYGDCGAEEFVEAEWTSCGDLVGYQGYNYETVLIGEDCWFVENVRYLPAVSAPSIGSEQDGLAHAYVYEWYGENGDVDAAMATTYYNDYGVLYNFQAVETWSLCPSGWHVPSSMEFRDLDVALGLPIGDFNDVGWSGAGAAIGTALKVEYGWCCGGGGTNTSGFSAKGAGGRWGDGQGPQFSDVGAASRWWTSTSSGENAWHHDVASQNAGVYWKDDAPKSRGHSVRCIKDTE